MSLTTEQLIAKWPIGKIIELSAETRQFVALLTKAPKTLSDFTSRLAGKTGVAGSEGDRISLENEEEMARVTKALAEVKEEMGVDAINLLESVYFSGSEITIDSMRGMMTHINMRVVTDAIHRVMWGTIRVDMMRAYNMDRKEWDQIDLISNMDQPGVIRVKSLHITDESTKEQTDARLEG